MSLREWQEADIPAIAEMETRCFPSDPWDEESLKMSFLAPFTHCFLVEEGGQVCGYCVLSVIYEDAEVLNVAVDIPYRGRGYGDALMQAMLDKAKLLGAEQIFLEVRVSNAPAIGLYKKYGYEQFGVRKKYYENGEDAFVMRKTL